MNLAMSRSLQRGRAVSEVFDVVFALLFFPKGEVFLKKLNDGFGVSEGLFIHIVNLIHGILKSGLGK
jgi:hypothetical protein